MTCKISHPAGGTSTVPSINSYGRAQPIRNLDEIAGAATTTDPPVTLPEALSDAAAASARPAALASTAAQMVATSNAAEPQQEATEPGSNFWGSTATGVGRAWSYFTTEAAAVLAEAAGEEDKSQALNAASVNPNISVSLVSKGDSHAMQKCSS